MKYLVERRLRNGAGLRRTRPRHHLYWRQMARESVLLYGGVWADGQGDTLIVQVDDVTSLHGVLDADPYVRAGLVAGTRTRQLGDEPHWHHGGSPARSFAVGPDAEAVAAAGAGARARAGAARGPATATAVRERARDRARDRDRDRDRDRAAAPSFGDEALSAHESRLSRMMLDGMTNRQMAASLGVSSRAVEQHITRIYRKLAISRRAQLAVALHGHPAAT